MKVIHNKQFCGVPGRSINQCNMELRDIIYYSNDNNINIGFLNLDWYKAFDLVPVEFVYQILEKLGFGITFIGWIRALYNGIESSLEINNILSDFFPINRSVRQGCPLSMCLFVIFQEPFYRAIMASQIIRPLRLPDSSELKVLGYADDTTLLILDSWSLLEIGRLIADFESATGFQLNKNKTSIFGAGSWANKEDWPLEWLCTKNDYLYSLGIYHGNSYNDSLNKNWLNITINLNTM